MRILLEPLLKKELQAALPGAALFHIGLGTKCFCVESGGRKYVLKERFDQAFRQERRAYEFLMARKFPHVQRYHGVLSVRGRRYLVFDHIEGNDLRACSLDQGQAEGVIRALACFHDLKKGQKPLFAGKALKKHLALVAGQKRMLLASACFSRTPLFLRYARSLEQIWKPIVQAAEGVLADSTASFVPALLHLDLDFLYGRNGRIYLIDMEDVAAGDPAWDLAGLCQAFPGLTERDVWACYGKHRAVDAEAPVRMRLYRAVLAALSLGGLLMDVMCINRGRGRAVGSKEPLLRKLFTQGAVRIAALLKTLSRSG